MKTSELEGALLDYWVAQHSPQCINMRFEWRGEHWVGIGEIDGKDEVIIAGAAPGFFAAKKVRMLYGKELMAVYRPSSDWSQGGPLIHLGLITLIYHPADFGAPAEWEACCGGVYEISFTSQEPLTAAMRAYVAGKFGNEVPDVAASAARQDNGGGNGN